MINIVKFSLLTVTIFQCFVTKGQDYTRYHTEIKNAEYQIFVKKNTDLGLKIYQQIFHSYDFVFAQDCITAIQIAIYVKKEKLFLEFAYKAFENGVKAEHLSKIKYIFNSSIYNSNKYKLQSVYETLRKKYIKRIDIDLLVKTYNLYINDQSSKNSPKDRVESSFKQDKKYKSIILSIIKELKTLSFNKGIPSDRLIGINQKDIMKELKSPHKDMIDYFNDKKDLNEYLITKSQFEINEYIFSSSLILPIMHHLPNSFSEFDTKFYIEQIRKGNIHPKDIAAINDFPYTVIPPKIISKNDLFFGVGVRFSETNSLIIMDSLINLNRKIFFIQNIESDRAKWKFMYSEGMHYSFGDFGCRS